MHGCAVDEDSVAVAGASTLMVKRPSKQGCAGVDVAHEALDKDVVNARRSQQECPRDRYIARSRRTQSISDGRRCGLTLSGCRIDRDCPRRVAHLKRHGVVAKRSHVDDKAIVASLASPHKDRHGKDVVVSIGSADVADNPSDMLRGKRHP